MSPNSGCWVSNFLEEDLGTTPNPLLRLGRFTSSWRDVPSPDAGRIVGSNLRLGHLQGGSSANALQERVCTSQCAPNSPDSVRCRTAWRSSLIRNSRGTRTVHGVRDHGDFPATGTGGHYTDGRHTCVALTWTVGP